MSQCSRSTPRAALLHRSPLTISLLSDSLFPPSPSVCFTLCGPSAAASPLPLSVNCGLSSLASPLCHWRPAGGGRRFPATGNDHARSRRTALPSRGGGGLPGTTALRVQFGDGSSHDFPSCWLRDNCQCDLCYDHKSFTRKLVLDDWDLDPEDYPVLAPDVRLRWKSGHESLFHGRWLHDRAFSESSRRTQRAFAALDKELWGPGFTVDAFDFEELMEDEATLFKWLVSLEKKGITLIKNTPQEPKACFSIVNKVGFVKPTHYGMHYPIRNKVGANSLAYTDSRLGMHNDLPYYHHVPGVNNFPTVYTPPPPVAVCLEEKSPAGPEVRGRHFHDLIGVVQPIWLHDTDDT
ncbi:putative gamma-butyrobetaine dioxygenase-like [Penaeus vannamei]|uniref:Putative gamma-butyrobetaine dioxygenase-like n=1 Tax=Penaeus vannamei TaxID=6689 RepID=A0A423S9Z6_PENVA|nr:putative gamma-butyrobetaine dioxygenase-like [Penaeus vannamei]